ncbi:hypothetical protein BC833DRAFT_614196 [Globomyces pollinis-pini]|nr:hypothetical protein BC833DRAFT_614196 [Globomyces pollinis-pini]
MSGKKLIVFVVGPIKSGKTMIANHLADLTESLETNEYHPTQGVRVLEFDRKIVGDAKKNQKWREVTIEVELWDCSGHEQQECFPTIKSNQSLIFMHRTVQTVSKGKFKTSNKILSKSPIIYSSIDLDPESIKIEFDAFLANAYTAFLENNDQEENAIMS